MIEKEFLDSLPDDPEEAFPLYEAHARKKFPNKDQESRENYVSCILGFLSAHGLNLGISADIPYESDAFNEYFDNAARKINTLAAQLSVTAAWKNKGKVAIYNMTPAIREAIRGHLRLIREKLSEVDLPDNRRELLSNRLGAFAAEIEKERARADLLASIHTAINQDVGKDAHKLIVLLQTVVKILDALARAEEYVPQSMGASGGAEIHRLAS